MASYCEVCGVFVSRYSPRKGVSSLCLECSMRRQEQRKKHSIATKPHHIYALVDPRDSKIKYIGNTVDPDRRLGGHISVGRWVTERSGQRRKWIHELQEQEITPLFVTLEIVDAEHAPDRERYWMETLYNLGAPLTNTHYLQGLKRRTS